MKPSMPGEAESSYFPRTIYVSQGIEQKVMKYAQEKGLVNTVRTLSIETGRMADIAIPRMQEAYRAALEEFFAGRCP